MTLPFSSLFAYYCDPALAPTSMPHNDGRREGGRDSISQRDEQNASSGQKRSLSNALELGPRKRPYVRPP